MSIVSRASREEHESTAAPEFVGVCVLIATWESTHVTSSVQR